MDHYIHQQRTVLSGSPETLFLAATVRALYFVVCVVKYVNPLGVQNIFKTTEHGSKRDEAVQSAYMDYSQVSHPSLNNYEIPKHSAVKVLYIT